MPTQAKISKYSRTYNGVLYYHISLISVQLFREPEGCALDCANIETTEDLVNIVKQLKKSFGVKKIVLMTTSERPPRKFLPKLTKPINLTISIPQLSDPKWDAETSMPEYATFPMIEEIGLIGWRFNIT